MSKTTNFTLALWSKPITWRPFKCLGVSSKLIAMWRPNALTLLFSTVNWWMLKPYKHVYMQRSTQTDKRNLRKNVGNNKKYILRKMGLLFRNLKFNILCNIFLVIKRKPFGVKMSVKLFWNKQKWLNKIMCFNFVLRD